MSARMLYLHTLSPLHCGTGQSADVIDLPIARERLTRWPVIPSSTIKGVLRSHHEEKMEPAALRSLFGGRDGEAADYAGALLFTDPHLLCFPARSHAGTFAWVTCPLALQRWARDHATGELPFSVALPPSPTDADLLVTTTSELVEGDKVYFEDLDFRAQRSPTVDALARQLGAAVFPGDTTWQALLASRLAVTSNDVFTFLTETATEIQSRVRLDEDSKTVAEGALWYEELVPEEAIFSAPVVPAQRAASQADVLFAHLDGDLTGAGLLAQVGGHSSVGRGLATLRLSGGV